MWEEGGRSMQEEVACDFGRTGVWGGRQKGVMGSLMCLGTR